MFRKQLFLMLLTTLLALACTSKENGSGNPDAGADVGDVGDVGEDTLGDVVIPDTLLAFSPSPLDFGGVRGGETQTFKVTMANDSALTLTLAEVRIQEGGSADFSVEKAPEFPVELAPKHSDAVEVAYTPTLGGTDTAVLVVVYEVRGQQRSQSVNLLGRQLGPVAVVTPDSLDFGWTGLGEHKTLDLEVSNGGDEDLVVSNVGLKEGSNLSLTVDMAGGQHGHVDRRREAHIPRLLCTQSGLHHR